jgi:hypothetical protein
MDPQKSTGQNPALQKRGGLSFDETRHLSIPND